MRLVSPVRVEKQAKKRDPPEEKIKRRTHACIGGCKFFVLARGTRNFAEVFEVPPRGTSLSLASSLWGLAKEKAWRQEFPSLSFRLSGTREKASVEQPDFCFRYFAVPAAGRVRRFSRGKGLFIYLDGLRDKNVYTGERALGSEQGLLVGRRKLSLESYKGRRRGSWKDRVGTPR